MELWQIPVIFSVGVITGIINTLAGGGSLLTLPMLIFMGLPPSTANGTNRLAIMVQNIFAVAGFAKKGVSDFKLSLFLSFPALLGAIIGSYIAVDISETLFSRILAVVMLIVLGLIIWDPSKRVQHKPGKDGGSFSLGKRRLIASMGIFFFVGIYGGFIQAGVGFIIIASLTSIGKLSLVETNSHKVFVVCIYTFFALIIFSINDMVCWTVGIALAAGNGLGGWIGSHLAVAIGDRWIRFVLIACVIAMVIKLSGLVV
ncbi:MAG: sulfite exporter TauE/SafE family protein [Planctomycetes bacterium]|nr:sulfite exporter TauE/SafE family protein [Planctomycetota bacterium]